MSCIASLLFSGVIPTHPPTVCRSQKELKLLKAGVRVCRGRFQKKTLVSCATAPEQAETVMNRPNAVTPAWQMAIDLLQSGEVLKTSIQSVNKSGVLVKVGKLSGFIPFKLMNRAVLESMDRNQLIGRDIEVKVTQVVVPERRLICSEKAVLLQKAACSLKPGDTIKGSVASLQSFGAFVEVEEPKEFAGVEIVLPLREISWDWVPTVSARLQKGDDIVAKVIDVKGPPRPRVVVSLKRMQDDPLTETLDKVLPIEGSGGYSDVGSVPAAVPTTVEDILDELSREEGVGEVTLGRLVEEKRTVSQDLELWITREAVVDGFNLVARAGRMVQEIHVTTNLSAAEMRATVERVLKRIN